MLFPAAESTGVLGFKQRRVFKGWLCSRGRWPKGCPLWAAAQFPHPCGRYDPDHVCNASDNAGRYAYNKQPEVCKWNLQKLAEALEPELPPALAEAVLAEDYDAEFHRHYLHKMRRKLGLVRAACEEDAALVARLLETMQQTGECWRPPHAGLSPLFPLSHFSAHHLWH